MKVVFNRHRLKTRVSQLGRRISRDYSGRTLDVVVMLENSFLFAADLVREISRPIVCHFVRSEMRDVRMGGYDRREIFFSAPPSLHGRDVLVVDAVLNTGVTQDFLIKRLEEGRFAWPPIVDERLALTNAQLALLLEGIDWRRTRAPAAARVPSLA